MALLPFRGDVLHGRGQKVDGFEDLEVALGVPAPFGAVDDLPGRFVPGDFFERKGRAQQILRQSFPPFDIVGRDGFLPGIKAETAVGPGEELAELALADEFFPAQQGEETVAEEFGKRFESLNRQDVEAPRPIHQPGGGEHVEVRMKIQVVPEGLHGGDGRKLSIRQLKPRTHPIT